MGIRAILMRTRTRACAWAAVWAALALLVLPAAANVRLDLGDLPPENRVGGFSGTFENRAGPNIAFVQHPCPENGPILAMSASGRLFWLSRDPLGEFADPLRNLYRFVGNNPLNAVDPLGLQMGWDDTTEAIFKKQSRLALVEPNAGNIQLRETGKAAVDSFLVGASFIPVGGAVGLSDDAVRASRGLLNARRAARVAGGYTDDAARAAGKIIARSSKCAPKTTTGLLTSGTRTPNAGGVIRSFAQEGDQVYYRVFSENAQGRFLTATPPRSSAWAREALALPEGNQATYIQEVLVPSGTRLQRSRALSSFGRRGGAEQFELLDQIPNGNFGAGSAFP